MSGLVERVLRGLAVALPVVLLVSVLFGKTEIVSSASGEVRPLGEVRRIQAPRSGRLLHWSGEAHGPVAEGVVLARLDTAPLVARSDALVADMLRREDELRWLQALLAEFTEVASERPVVAASPDHAAARELELAIRARVEVEQAVHDQALHSADVHAQGLTERQHWLEQRCVAERQLYARGGLPAREVWQAELDCGTGLREQREAEAGVVAARLRAAQVAATEWQRRQELCWQWRQSVRENARELGRLRAEFAAVQAELGESVITAPMAGQLEPQRVLHPGAWVQAGELLALLVPVAASRIEARLPESERPGVQVGQDVRVRVHALPWTRHGSLPGRVLAIAAEAEHSEGQPPAFKVAIEPGEHHLGAALKPGMQVTVDFLRGRETLWRWLLRPLQESWDTALREP